MDRIQRLTTEELDCIGKLVMKHTRSQAIRAYSGVKRFDFEYNIMNNYITWFLVSSEEAREKLIAKMN